MEGDRQGKTRGGTGLHRVAAPAQDARHTGPRPAFAGAGAQANTLCAQVAAASVEHLAGPSDPRLDKTAAAAKSP